MIEVVLLIIGQFLVQFDKAQIQKQINVIQKAIGAKMKVRLGLLSRE